MMRPGNAVVTVTLPAGRGLPDLQSRFRDCPVGRPALRPLCNAVAAAAFCIET